MAKLSDAQIREVIDGLTGDAYIDLVSQLTDKGAEPNDWQIIYHMDNLDAFFSGYSTLRFAQEITKGSGYDSSEFDAFADYFRFTDGRLQSMTEEDVIEGIIGGESFDYVYTALEELSENDDLPEVVKGLIG